MERQGPASPRAAGAQIPGREVLLQLAADPALKLLAGGRMQGLISRLSG